MENTIILNGEEFIKKSEVKELANIDGLDYVVVRTYSAGVFAGFLKERNGKEVTLLYARRIWYWDGAASLSELAMKGTSKPENCKFPCEVDEILLTEAIEIIKATNKAMQSIRSVKEWTAHE